MFSRKTAIVLLSTVFVLLVVTLYVSVYSIVKQGFSSVEQKYAIADVERVKDAINREAEHLAVLGTDYGYWDQSYRFMAGKNPGYVDDFIFDTFQSSNMNVYLLFDTKGKLVFGRAFDLETAKETDIPGEIINELGPTGLLAKAIKTPLSGVISLNGRSIIVSATPVLPTNKIGEPAGVLVMGRMLDRSLLKTISKTTGLTFEIFQFGSVDAPRDVYDASKIIADTNSIYLSKISRFLMYGYVNIDDITGRPAVVARVNIARDIALQGRTALNYLFLFLVLMSAVFIMILVITVFMFKQAEKALTDSNAELKRVNQIKSSFVSVAAHELRSPLSSIKGGIDLLYEGIDGPLSEKQKETADIVKRNVDRLIHLINNVLDYSRLETGKVIPRFNEADLTHVISDVCRLRSSDAERNGIGFSANLPDGEIIADCDADQIRQVAANLIDNAVKYTKKGGEVVVSLTHDMHSATFEVKDTGIGIKEKDLAHIFEAFVQVHDRTAVKVTGSGLGLSICKQIIEKHGGKITADSVYGEGSTFTFTIPLRQEQ